MDEKLKQAMIQDLHEAIGYVELPEHAKSLEELTKESGGMTDSDMRKSLKILVESGEWGRKRVGNKMYYWKVVE